MSTPPSAMLGISSASLQASKPLMCQLGCWRPHDQLSGAHLEYDSLQAGQDIFLDTVTAVPTAPAPVVFCHDL